MLCCGFLVRATFEYQKKKKKWRRVVKCIEQKKMFRLGREPFQTSNVRVTITIVKFKFLI